MKSVAPKQEGLITALDIGSAKVACVIADVDAEGHITVRGVGNRACNGGVVGGAVVDMTATERAIRASVDQAEKMAGVTVSDVWLTFSGGNPKSTIVEAQVDVTEHAVSQADLDRAIAEAKGKAELDGASLLHIFPAAYGLDGVFGTKPPIGLYGKKLAVALHMITAEAGPLQNLQTCVRRAHLNVAGIVATPFASGLATLVEDEMKMGAACVDIGGGTTSISVFAQGALVHAEVFPVGGEQITEQVARALLTPFDQAERLKTFSGAAIVDSVDERIELEVPQVGETGDDSIARLPKRNLTAVMQKELELLFSTVGDRLDASGFSGVTGRRVVVTGGTSQSERLRDLASQILGRQVRIGRPEVVSGLPQAAQNPTFSAAVGLLLYVARRPVQDMHEQGQSDRTKISGDTSWKRLSSWLKANF